MMVTVLLQSGKGGGLAGAFGGGGGLQIVVSGSDPIGIEAAADAIVVELPFFDTGATCDNVDDYDEVCPYTGSTSPDVVYLYVNPDQFELCAHADIDLFGSSYDTKVYVYDGSLNVLACNDDYYFDGRTSTCMKVPCALTLFTRICVPVWGTCTLPIGFSDLQ